MRSTTVWPALLGVEKTVVERVEFDEDEEMLVAHVRPRRRSRSRCGICRRPCPGYDRGEAGAGGGRWTWGCSGRLGGWPCCSGSATRLSRTPSGPCLGGTRNIREPAVRWPADSLLTGLANVDQAAIGWAVTAAQRDIDRVRLPWRDVLGVLCRALTG